MHISSQHLQDWIASQQGVVVPVAMAARFGAYLGDLPWVAGGLDWQKIGGLEANLAKVTDADLLDWLRNTALGNEECLVFWYGANEPAIACETGFAILNLDHAFWKAPGRRYVFGAKRQGAEIIPCYEHFAEYDGGDRLIARRRSQ